MKSLLIVFMLLWAVQAVAQPAVLGPKDGVEWNASISADVKEYELWGAVTSGGHDFTVPAFATILHPLVSATFTLTEPVDGEYFIVVTARDHAGNRSGPSNEIHIKYDSTAPGPVQIRLIFGKR